MNYSLKTKHKMKKKSQSKKGDEVLNKPVVSGSLYNTNFGIDNPIAKGEINTGGVGYKALEIKESVVVGYYAATKKNGEHNVIGLKNIMN